MSNLLDKAMKYKLSRRKFLGLGAAVTTTAAVSGAGYGLKKLSSEAAAKELKKKENGSVPLAGIIAADVVLIKRW